MGKSTFCTWGLHSGDLSSHQRCHVESCECLCHQPGGLKTLSKKPPPVEPKPQPPKLAPTTPKAPKQSRERVAPPLPNKTLLGPPKPKAAKKVKVVKPEEPKLHPRQRVVVAKKPRGPAPKKKLTLPQPAKLGWVVRTKGGKIVFIEGTEDHPEVVDEVCPEYKWKAWNGE
jgi:hypothetical protein